MMPILIEKKFGKANRKKVVGYRTSRVTGSTSDWNKAMNGRRWFIMMVWNWSANQHEHGWSTARVRKVYNRKLVCRYWKDRTYKL